MITGMPSGLSLARFDAFGMCTRLTARGFHDVMDWCTRTAICALASGVNATSPSIPAVLRPVLRCVTRRTLTSVLARLRSISFCRFLTFGQSCSRAALKIRCRSRRTSSSQACQSMASQAGSAPSGPFTLTASTVVSVSMAPNLPFGSGGPGCFTSKAHLPTSAPFRAGQRPGIRPVIRDGQRRASHAVPVSRRLTAHRHSLLRHPVPARDFGLRYLRLTGGA